MVCLSLCFPPPFHLLLLPRCLILIQFYEKQVAFYPPYSPPTASGSSFPLCSEHSSPCSHIYRKAPSSLILRGPMVWEVVGGGGRKLLSRFQAWALLQHDHIKGKDAPRPNKLGPPRPLAPSTQLPWALLLFIPTFSTAALHAG